MGCVPCVDGSFYFCFSLDCKNFLGSSEVLEDMLLAGRVVLGSWPVFGYRFVCFGKCICVARSPC